MNKKLLSRYYRRVRHALPVGSESKQRFLADLQLQAEQYLQAHPQADITDLETALGTPDEIAASFLEEMSYSEIAPKFRLKNRILGIAAAVALLCVLIFGISIGILVIDHLDDGEGYFETRPVTIIQPGEKVD